MSGGAVVDRRGDDALTTSRLRADVSRAIPALAELAASSAIRPCVTRARSAARVANNDPAADYPAAVLGARRDDQDEPAQHRRRRFLHRHVFDRAGGRRDRHGSLVSRSAESGLHEIPQSRFALRDGGRLRCEDEGRRARRGDRCRALRLPRAGDGSGAREGLPARCDCRDRDRPAEV